ncbi:energy-coupling factor transporter transmembrane component T family protein [Citricoccus sp. NR2]|uniref:energy-coupling factor transporter transmembrane component T family protein n=1 Tax=Citricoccus sp. NR2 TaxID=3004095 RepID=UPI0022DE8DE1|nr:energy-coupling factor transporter transmembrane component T [Citricoccus sp. NR2]WBL19457.1 energy-coupling factor transporter transmembrane component T [Citricoccus sp. NR2]
MTQRERTQEKRRERQRLRIVHPSTLVEPGVLTRWNPSVKLVTLFVVSLALLLVWDPWRPAALWLGLVAVALTLGKVPWRWLALAHIPFIAFALGLFLVNVFTRDNGVAIGIALAGRTLAIGVASILFLCSTAPVELMRSLNQNLKLPASITFAVLAGYQLLLDLPREWQTIRAAQLMRAGAAPQLGDGRAPKLRVREAGRLAFTVLIVALRRSERIATSLESRGFGLKPRTVYRPVVLRTRDVVAGLMVSLAAVAYCWPW